MSGRVHAQEDSLFLITTCPAGSEQWRLAGVVLGILIVALLITAPFASIPLNHTLAFLPAYATAVSIVDLITAAMLFALFSVHRSSGILLLSIGYLYLGITALPWALTFPGIPSLLGLPEAGLQSTAAIAALRRLGFPIFVLGYALLNDAAPTLRTPQNSALNVIAASIVGVALVSGGLAWLIITSDALPSLMQDTRNVSALWQYVPAASVCLYVVCLFALWVRHRSVLDLWLKVVICTLLIEIILISFLGSGLRLSVGWWAGRIYGLLSASIVLLVLLSETMALYGRLARSIAAERHAREARLTEMEALSASIAHEVNQPLASMVTNADAGMRWLERPLPNLDEARAALTRIVTDGHRTAKVIEGIRTMFKKGTQGWVVVNMNQLIEETLRRHAGGAQLRRTTMHADFYEGLPRAIGSPVQLQQVLSNLVANAIDAMSAVTGRDRVLHVKTALQEPGEILVSFGDSGTGLDRDAKDRVFEPFYTTKPDGMGMGLMLCRSVIEAHGGRLWVADNEPHGAVFHFTVPVAAAAFPAVDPAP